MPKQFIYKRSLLENTGNILYAGCFKLRGDMPIVLYILK